MEGTCMPARFVFGLAVLWLAVAAHADEVPLLVRDILPGSASSSPDELTSVNGTLFFRAFDPTNGTELWRTDTTTGAVLVKDISTGDSSPSELTKVNGTLFFRAFDGNHGEELWRSDGTAAGTVLVGDINPGSGASFPQALTDVNGRLFFAAFEPNTGIELWALRPPTGCR